MHTGMPTQMKPLLAIATAFLVVGCSTTTTIPSVLRCPTELPTDLHCEECAEYVEPEITYKEDLEAAYDLLRIALIDCRHINKVCLKRDRIILKAHQACPEDAS